MNRKAAVTDAVFVPAFILVIACTILIGLYVWATFADVFADVVADSPSNATVVEAMDTISVSLASFDYMFPIMVFGLMIISLIFAYRTGANVIYAIVSIVLWALALMMSVIYSNIFETISASFPTVTGTIPIISFMVLNMKWIVLAWLLLISIVMFTRNKQEDQNISAQEMMYGGYR